MSSSTPTKRSFAAPTQDGIRRRRILRKASSVIPSTMEFDDEGNEMVKVESPAKHVLALSDSDIDEEIPKVQSHQKRVLSTSDSEDDGGDHDTQPHDAVVDPSEQEKEVEDEADHEKEQLQSALPAVLSSPVTPYGAVAPQVSASAVMPTISVMTQQPRSQHHPPRLSQAEREREERLERAAQQRRPYGRRAAQPPCKRRLRHRTLTIAPRARVVPMQAVWAAPTSASSVVSKAIGHETARWSR